MSRSMRRRIRSTINTEGVYMDNNINRYEGGDNGYPGSSGDRRPGNNGRQNGSDGNGNAPKKQSLLFCLSPVLLHYFLSAPV